MDWDSMANSFERKIRERVKSIARKASDSALIRLHDEADNSIAIDVYEEEMRRRHLI